MQFTIIRIEPFLQMIIQDTFETLTFSEVTNWRKLEDKPLNIHNRVCCGIHLIQPICGNLYLSIDRDHCLDMVNSARVDEMPDEAEKLLNDFSGELLNIIAGRLEAEFADTIDEVRIGLPTFNESWSDIVVKKSDSIIYAFNVNESLCYCQLT